MSEEIATRQSEPPLPARNAPSRFAVGFVAAVFLVAIMFLVAITAQTTIKIDYMTQIKNIPKLNALSFPGLDVAAKVNAACAANPGATVTLPSGNLSFTNTLTGANGCTVIGAGRAFNGTTLTFTGSSLRPAINLFQTSEIRLSNFMLTTANGAGTGIVIAGASNTTIDNVQINGATSTSGFAAPIHVTWDGTNASNVTRISHVDITGQTGPAIQVDHAIETYLDTMFLGSTPNGTTAQGLLVDSGTSGLYLHIISSVYGLHGFWVQNTFSGGVAPQFIFGDQVLADTTSGGYGCGFDTSLGTSVVSAVITNLWCAASGRSRTNTQVTAGAGGLLLAGGRELYFSSCRIRSNDADGVSVTGSSVSNYTFDHCLIVDNNQGAHGGASPTSHGMHVSAAAVSGALLNSRIGDVQTGDQGYAMVIDSVEASEFRFENNDCNSNTDGCAWDSNLGHTTNANNTCTGAHCAGSTQQFWQSVEMNGNHIDKLTYVQSISANPSSVGMLSLAASDLGMCWRNAGNTGNDCWLQDVYNDAKYQGPVQATRMLSSGGTPQAAANISTTSAWGVAGGPGSGISSATGLYGFDQSTTFTVTAGAGAISANPQFTITFADGAWPGGSTPSCIAIQIGGSGAMNQISIISESSTAVTYEWNGTPLNTSTYRIRTNCWG